MTDRNIKQVEVLEQLKRKEISAGAASCLLKLSSRQVRRKLKKFLLKGAESLVHGNRGRPSNRAIPDKLRAQVLELIKTKYHGFGPTFASEKMEELEQIKIGPETLRLLLIREGLWQRQRKRKQHRRWRKPKDFFGEMVQLDGSIHFWIDGEYWTLIKFVDDATRQILWMEFARSECWKSVCKATINYFKKHGIPVSIYTDRGKVFKVNVNNKENEFLTQYQKSLSALEVDLIHAHSPQAKGRIERSFRTDQDRLIKEIKLAGITTMEEANSFLQNYYIPKMNKKFAIQATKDGNLHRSISKNNLHNVFCFRAKRTVQNNWVTQYKKRLFQLEDSRPAIVKPKDIVTIHERLDGSVFISIRSNILEFKEIKERHKPMKKIFSNKIYKPKEDHPWRTKKPIFKSQKTDISTLLKTGHF